MEYIWMFAMGAVIAAISWMAVPLSWFIQKIEDETVCQACGQYEDCVAMKKLFSGKSNYVSEWMLISFIRIRKKCSNIERISMNVKMVCFVLSMVFFLISLWSRGVNIIGFTYGISAMMLFFLSVVDWNTQYIPLECNIIILICGLIHLFADFSNWEDYLIGLIAVSGFLFLVDRIATPILAKRYLGEEMDSVIGDGDIKLMAATGLLLGWKLNFLALGIGCITGSVIHLIRMKIKGSNARLALGPYLSLGVYITMICGEQLVSWYLDMMGYIPY